MPARQVSAWLRGRAGHKVVPHRSGVHRCACLTLYKHLIRLIPRSSLDQKLLKDVLRYEFRKDARLRVHADIRQSLTTGYRALSLLQALQAPSQLLQPGQSNQESVDFKKGDNESPTSTLFQQIATLNQDLQNLVLSRPPEPPARPPPPRLWPYPGGNKILSRPLPASALTGPRHVPKLVNASGLPFLRAKKPQPALISKILRDKLATRQKRQDHLIALDEYLVWAKDEDEWDLRLEGLRRDTEVYGISSEMESEARSEMGFADNTRECIKHVNRLLSAEAAKQAELAKRLWKIVLQEQELADREMNEKKQAYKNLQ